MEYLYLAGTIFFTVYGQLIIKWQIVKYGSLPAEFYEKLIFLIKLVIDPFIFSGLVSAFIAALFWLAAMTKLQISFAYPFMGLSYVLVFVFSVFLFKEPATIYKITGIILIVLGIFISSRSG